MPGNRTGMKNVLPTFVDQLLAESLASTIDPEYTTSLVTAILSETDTAFEGAGRMLIAKEEKYKNPLASKVWRMYTKARDTLPNSSRMENLSWRMMAVSLSKRKEEDDQTSRTANHIADDMDIDADECLENNDGVLKCEADNVEDYFIVTPPKADDTTVLLSSSAPPYSLLSVFEQQQQQQQQQQQYDRMKRRVALVDSLRHSKNNVMIAGSTRAMAISKNDLPHLIPAEDIPDYTSQQLSSRSITIPFLTEEMDSVTGFCVNNVEPEPACPSMGVINKQLPHNHHVPDADRNLFSSSWKSEALKNDIWLSLSSPHQLSLHQPQSPTIATPHINLYQLQTNDSILAPFSSITDPTSSAVGTAGIDTELLQRTFDRRKANESGRSNIEETPFYCYSSQKDKAHEITFDSLSKLSRSVSSVTKSNIDESLPFTTNSLSDERTPASPKSVSSNGTEPAIEGTNTADDVCRISLTSTFERSINTAVSRNNKGSKPCEQIPSPALRRTQCFNCQTVNTPLWRRDPEGRALCNACGLFLKLHGCVRPLSLKRDIIKKRNRNNNTSSSADKEGDRNLTSSSGKIKLTEKQFGSLLPTISLTSWHKQQKAIGRPGKAVGSTINRRSYQRKSLHKVVVPHRQQYGESLRRLAPIAMATQSSNSDTKLMVETAEDTRPPISSSPIFYHSSPVTDQTASSPRRSIIESNNSFLTETTSIANTTTSEQQQIVTSAAATAISGSSRHLPSVEAGLGRNSNSDAARRDAAINAILKSVGIDLDNLPPEILPLIATAATYRASTPLLKTKEQRQQQL